MMGETMESADILTFLKGLAGGSPITGFALYLWYRTDNKLDKLQDRYATAMETSNTSRVDLATALSRLADKITGVK